jgi:hypothetical protein
MSTAKYKLRKYFNTQEQPNVPEDFLKSIITRLCNDDYENTVVFSYKEHEQWIKDNIGCEVNHLWCGRGSNEYKEMKYLILFAGGFSNKNELLDDCRALWKDDPVPIDNSPLPQNQRKFQDERIELLRTVREQDELIQVAHRIRPVNATHKDDKHLILIHRELITELSPDSVIEPQTFRCSLAKTKERLDRRNELRNIINLYVDEYGFWHDNVIQELRDMDKDAEIAGTRVNISSRHGSNKTYILIRGMTRTSIHKGLEHLKDITYADNFKHDKNGFQKDRDAILQDLGLERNRLNINRDGRNHPLVVYGNVEAAKRVFEVTVSRSVVNNQIREGLNSTITDILASCNGHRKLVEEILGYGEVLTNFDMNLLVQNLWNKPVPDFWDAPKDEVFFIQLRGEVRLEFHNRVTAYNSHCPRKDRIGDLFRKDVRELCGIYNKLNTRVSVNI